MISYVLCCNMMSSVVSFDLIWCHRMSSYFIRCHLMSSDATLWYLTLDTASFKRFGKYVCIFILIVFSFYQKMLGWEFSEFFAHPLLSLFCIASLSTKFIVWHFWFSHTFLLYFCVLLLPPLHLIPTMVVFFYNGILLSDHAYICYL